LAWFAVIELINPSANPEKALASVRTKVGQLPEPK